MRIEQAIRNKPNLKYILIDFDNTLAFTDKANNKAYEYAIEEIIGKNFLNHLPQERITRNNIKELTSINNNETLDKIIKRKEECYHLFLTDITLNIELINELSKLSCLEILKIIIVSKANIKRIKQTLAFFNEYLIKCDFHISQIICCFDSDNKYRIAIEKLKCNKEDVFVIDNEQNELDSGIAYGISILNTLRIFNHQII